MSSPRFLIVNYSAIGDCVMAIPAVSAIRRTYPDAFIAWAIDEGCAAVADTVTLLNLRHEAQRRKWKNSGKPLNNLRQQLSYYLALQKLHFDFGIDFQGHSKTAICLRIANPKKRVARRGTDVFARFLNPVAPEKDHRVHRVERQLEVLRALGDFVEEGEPIYPKLLQQRCLVRSKFDSSKKLASITVGAGTRLKVVPIEHWRVVGRSLLDQGFQVAYLGGPADPKPEVEGAIDLVGKSPLAESIAIVAESDLHLCGDTGMGHIAAAYDTPVISIFGDQPPHRYRPYTERAIVLREGTEARNVQPHQVIEAITEMRDRYGI